MGTIFLIFWLCTAPFAAAQSVATPSDPPPPPVMPLADTSLDQFRPGIAITVGIFTTIFSITFLVLLYVKHCRKDMYTTHSSVDHHYHHHHHHQKSGGGGGVDIKVIQALPIFRFSSLRGQKEGLECAVCLNPFEPDEVMRLLPKCKHAFHVECVDVWLEANPTCPLCRYRVDPEDVLLVDTKSLFNFREKATPRSSEQGRFGSGRVSGRHSSAGPLEIIIEKSKADDVAAASQRRASLDSWSSKKKTGSGNRGKSFEGSGRRSSSSRRDGKLPLMQGDSSSKHHRLEHRIVLDAEEEEGEGGKRRWSEAEAADTLYLGSEMIMEECGSGSGVINGRSVSEITGVNRSNNGGSKREKGHGEGEGVMRRWVSWISQSQHQQSTAGNSAASSSTSAIV